jgi:hypothetical protein
MERKKEFIAGLLFIFLSALVIWLVGGLHGLLRVVVAILIAWLCLYLLNRKSLLPKAGAMILSPDLLVKLLMPRSYRKAIKDLEKAEKKD